ncbi:MAG: hypothetical protein FGM18_07585 [Burkholderiaceae bacterium]|nr:hypothetical protein [Burkholderiaceae bacterium]
MQILRQRIHLVALLLGTALLAGGCGFTIRGQDLGLPFKTIAIEGNHSVANEIRQFFWGQSNVKIVPKAVDAQVVLIISAQAVERTVVAFSAAGRPREIQLRMRVGYKINDGYGVEIASTQEINQTRDLTISDSEVLSISVGEGAIVEDMQKDIAWQLVRRLRAVKLPN